MIYGVDAGKTYKLIDKGVYISNYTERGIILRHFNEDMSILIDSVDNRGRGSVDRETAYYIILPSEYKYFELVEDTLSLQTINSPFGELDKQTKKDLLCAWVDGAEIELWIDILECWSYPSGIKPTWKDNTIYRVKPTISAKDSAKAKLISEAQQQLRDAQEALDKAQQL